MRKTVSFYLGLSDSKIILMYIFYFLYGLKLDDLTVKRSCRLWLNVFIRCLIETLALAVISIRVCWLTEHQMYDTHPPPHDCAVCLLITARGSFWDRRWWFDNTDTCAVCNLISKAVVSDGAAALTRYALPEWQIGSLQLGWRVECPKFL